MEPQSPRENPPREPDVNRQIEALRKEIKDALGNGSAHTDPAFQVPKQSLILTKLDGVKVEFSYEISRVDVKVDGLRDDFDRELGHHDTRLARVEASQSSTEERLRMQERMSARMIGVGVGASVVGGAVTGLVVWVLTSVT